jgi:hypothetical protein
MKKQIKTQTKPVDYTPLITRNEKGTVLSIPTSAISGWISIYPDNQASRKEGQLSHVPRRCQIARTEAEITQHHDLPEL